MTHKEILNLLRSSGVGDVSYDHFDEDPKTESYLTYAELAPEIFYADNQIYFVGPQTYVVDLYTDIKSPTIEQQLETALTQGGLTFSKAPSEWLEDTGQYVTTYEITGDDT